jgi:hypothetical protein
MDKTLQFLQDNMAPIKQWPFPTIDIDAIATGMLKMTESLPEEYQTALVFGMLPAPLMALLTKILEEKLKNECCKFYDMPETEEYRALFELPQDRLNTVIRKISTNMLHNRKQSIG